MTLLLDRQKQAFGFVGIVSIVGVRQTRALSSSGKVQIGTMSVGREVLSETKKLSYFCKVCQVACLNKDGLLSHYNDEEHIKMEEVYYGQKYGKHYYSSLPEYISCPKRKEPLIGLQYIIQLYPEIKSQDAFKCSLCKVIGPLHFIMRHIESFKHRRTYLSTAHKHLFPLYTKQQTSYYDRSVAVREHAIKVEQQESTFSVKDLKSCASRIGVKSDFWKYSIRRQEKLEEYKKKLSAYETQKNNILQYMETLVITSPEEAALVQNLTEELEAAVNAFNLNSKPRYPKSYKREREQSTEYSEGRYSRHSDFSRSKKRSIWYEKFDKPSRSSSCNDDVQSISDKQSATEKERSRKRSRSASKDMLLKVTFSTGSGSDAKNANLQEQQESLTACPVKEQLEVSSDHLSNTRETPLYNWNVRSDLSQGIRAKPNTKYSPDVAKWESLFANNPPEMSRFVFSSVPQLPSFDNTEESLAVERKENPRRASLDALSTFTLFSQGGHEHGSASCPQSSHACSSLQSPGFKSYKGSESKDKAAHYEFKLVNVKNEEFPCSSNTVCTEAGTMDDIVMHNEPEQHDDECNPMLHETTSRQNSEVETNCDQLSDVNANVAQTPKSSHILDASSEYSDLNASGSKHLGTKTDSQAADSNVFGNTLTSGNLRASGRQLSPEVLQLFKGKDTDSIVHILKTLSPFYPALQELDLEVFAQALSKTGAIME